MNQFKKNEFQIKEDDKKKYELDVKNIDPLKGPELKEFSLSPIYKSNEMGYKEVRLKYGSLAATDTHHEEKSQKNSRFSLNSLLREPLSVEQEEKRVIEERVQVLVKNLAEAAKADAFRVGHEEGFKKGYEEAFKQMQDDSAENIKKFDEVVQSAENAKLEILKANETFILEVIFRVSKMIILKELKTDEEYILRLVKDLINRVGVKDNIKIQLNPDDMQTIDSLKVGLEKAYGTLNNLNIESSSQVKRGGCRIGTEWNTIDASIETQLQGIYDSLLSKS